MTLFFQLPIIITEDSADSKQFEDTDQSHSESDRSMAATVTIKLLVKCAKGVHLNEEAPNSWKLATEGRVTYKMFSDDKF